MSRTVALFGGSFDPPHLAHQMVCLYVLEACDVDELRMVPTYAHAFGKQMQPFEHRLAMCRLAANVFGGRVAVSDVERELAAGPNRTLDTLRALSAREPDVRFRLVVGADILAESHKWYGWSQILMLAPPIVLGREGYTGGDADAPALPDISSTEIRRRLAAGATAVPLVSRAVMDYIAQRDLYR